MVLRGFSKNSPTGSGYCGWQGSLVILVEYKLLSLSLSLSRALELSSSSLSSSQALELSVCVCFSPPPSLSLSLSHPPTHSRAAYARAHTPLVIRTHTPLVF